ncbi:MAG: hypothetical protein JWM11_1278 [Planctomycetaceae bacterium]|nr:hypothetical protein [Planctomycetaceae bacterium]
MNQRPTIAPAVLATIITAAPERLQKKLDREPRVADSWNWEHADGQWTISAGEEQVRIPAGTITDVIQVQCSCLLSPRCFHVLAVLNVADIATVDDLQAAGNDSAVTSGTTELSVSESDSNETPGSAKIELSESQLMAARQMYEACAAILTSGLRASGAVLQSRLLRAIHECRSEGLHRIAAGGLRLLSNLRLLRDGDDQFTSAAAENDFRDVLEVCLRVIRSAINSAGATLELVGIARRSYEPVNSLKLHGLFCEPVLTRSGYGGVVTWLMADDGWIGTVSDVQPGNASRINQAWQSGVSLAGLSLSHRDLSRKCLLISKATRSVDGRLGGGESARAVTIEGQGWNAPPVAQRFKTPLVEQIRRVFANQNGSEFLKPAGADLVFFAANVLGFSGQELVVRIIDSGAILRLALTLDDDQVAFRASLTMLSRAPGLALRCVGRVDLNSAGRINLLAIAPAETDDSEAPRLLPSDASPVLSIGLEEVTRSQLSKAQTHPVSIELGESSPLITLANSDESLERWLRAIVVGGRHAIPQGLVTSAVRDAARLKSSLRPTAASLLHGLTQSTISTTTDLKGMRFAEDPAILAEKWLAASIGSRAATNYLQMLQWMQILK